MRPHPSNIGIRAVLNGIIVNVIFSIVKGVAGVIGHSTALTADAIESASDVITSVIVLVGLKMAAKAPDEDHPYGHGKAEPMAAIAVSLSLVLAAVFILVKSFQQILSPVSTPEWFTLPVLISVIIIKEILYRRVSKKGKEIESTAVIGEAWHHRSDAISSLVALIGISIAVIGGKGYESADGWAALVASGIIIFNSYRIFKPAFLEVLDTAPPEEVIHEIKAIASSIPKVKAIEKCFVRKMGLEYVVDIHVMVDPDLSVREGHAIAHAVKDEIMDKKPAVFNVFTHIEPLD